MNKNTQRRSPRTKTKEHREDHEFNNKKRSSQ